MTMNPSRTSNLFWRCAELKPLLNLPRKGLK